MVKPTEKDGSSDGESVNKTFRIKRPVISRIEADAEKEGISTNALVNNILTRYVDWDRVANEIGFVSLAPNMIHGLLAVSTEDQMGKAGDNIGKNSCFKDLSLHYFQKYDSKTFMKLALLLQKYGNNYKVQGETNHNGGSDLSFYHDLGKKWSSLIGTMLHYELNRIGMQHTFEISDNAVVFRFPNNKVHGQE
jgi:hypothetical protein